ncbi:MgtC/SapB family protein [Rhizobium leguminosarum]|uniref:MgtC/SapB family protein n=1 Tax=Rhizobium leguminosarum TaxID=384 RepID=UPI000FEF7CA0|nr:MgtC/SapB family protein [Rhizobium leguminosarum]RWY83941.1 MgtC/SapB family protein [Rhizobium leguminosarum]
MDLEIMPVVPTWTEIAWRLALTVAAGCLIGLNREAGSHPAGFRTTLLVGLAACLAMIQANLLVGATGKTDQSFAVMDTLRFPLGILTGMGFIGGGAILKRGDMVTGVTTAATLWIMTAIGLCIGGGQWIVGSTGAIIAFVVLSPFKMFDEAIPRMQKARIVIEPFDSSDIVDLSEFLPADSSCRFIGRKLTEPRQNIALSFKIGWRRVDLIALSSHLEEAGSKRFRIVELELLNTTT